MASPQRYQSYLLRLWCNSAQNIWCGSLQSTASGEQYRFQDINALFAFLLAQMAVAGERDGGEAQEAMPPTVYLGDGK